MSSEVSVGNLWQTNICCFSFGLVMTLMTGACAILSTALFDFTSCSVPETSTSTVTDLGDSSSLDALISGWEVAVAEEFPPLPPHRKKLEAISINETEFAGCCAFVAAVGASTEAGDVDENLV